MNSDWQLISIQYIWRKWISRLYAFSFANLYKHAKYGVPLSLLVCNLPTEISRLLFTPPINYGPQIAIIDLSTESTHPQVPCPCRSWPRYRWASPSPALRHTGPCTGPRCHGRPPHTCSICHVSTISSGLENFLFISHPECFIYC